jgi:chitin deacetylase
MVILFLGFAGAATYKIMNSRKFQFFGGIVTGVNTDDKVVALTFDDGPSQNADEILSILDSENVKATFFLIGEAIQEYPEETKKIIDAGHEIGNHTYSHKMMIFLSPASIRNEIEKTDDIIIELGYKDVIQFRPPYGKKILFLPYYLHQHNRKTILWDLEPNSYPKINSSSDRIVQYVAEQVKPGSIILLHPWNKNNRETIDSIKGIIEALRSEGYEFKTVNELLNYSSATK